MVLKLDTRAKQLMLVRNILKDLEYEVVCFDYLITFQHFDQ